MAECFVVYSVLDTHITSVLFCGLTNSYIRVLVHRLNNPVFVFPVTDMLLTETESSYLAYMISIDRNQFCRAEITVDLKQ